MWVRHRKCWNTGPGDWEWIYYSSKQSSVLSDDELHELCLDLEGEDKYLDAFRGVEAEQAEPPREVVEKHIASLRTRLTWLTREIQELEATLAGKG